MRNNSSTLSLALGIVILCVCGCWDESTETQPDLSTDSQTYSPVVMAVKDRIRMMSSEVDDGLHAFGSWREITEFNDLIHGVHDLDCRRRLVEEYGQTLLSIELARPPYRRWENATFGYFQHMEQVVRLMCECDCPPRRQLDFFFSGLSKFRDACLSVPNDSKIQGESSKERMWRHDCAHKLPLEYAQRLSEIRRFWLPRLDKRFPVECHDEFKRRIAPFMQEREDR